jgi:acetyl-CoA C-acetyltransferase
VSLNDDHLSPQVVPGGNAEVLQAAEDFAAQILLCSPCSIQASLQVVKRSMAEEPSVLQALKMQHFYPTVQRMNKSPNMIEGPVAFSEKRAPSWTPPEPLGKFSAKL